ncbi:MAG: folylpolyglutamate synthase/dihydrofolate synthase family protein [Myxococcota bacterium]
MATDEPIENVTQAAAWLESLINLERDPSLRSGRFDLEPIRRLLERLDHPEAGLSIVHVAGSKGKGSTCLFAEAILRTGGELVGTFTSPHLERWTERFRLDGREVEGEELAHVVETMRPHVELMRREDPTHAPTFFDATTAAALILFARAGVDRALLEVGLGGRLDSTNVVEPASTCVTQIELEHTDRLGDTLAAIAGEKAGILKSGVPCVAGRLEASAEAVVVARAEEVGAPLRRLGHEFDAVELEAGSEAFQASCPEGTGRGFLYRDAGGLEACLGLRVLGSHQIDNAALAVAAVGNLPGWSDSKLIESARIGLLEAHLPGRLELLQESPRVLVDSAHTARSAMALRRVLDETEVGVQIFVLSMSRDKNAKAVLSALISADSKIWLTRAEPHRSADPRELARLCQSLAPGCSVQWEEDPRIAIEAARRACGPDDLLCCSGSVYLAGIARAVLGRG